MQIGATSPRRRPQLVDLNFVPVELRPRVFPFLTVGLALALVGGVLLLFGLAYASGDLDVRLAKSRQQVAEAQSVVNAANEDAARANLERQRIVSMQDDYRALAERQISWSRVLAAIADAPSGVSVESVEQSGFGVTVRGRASSYGATTEYLAGLRESDLFHDIALEVTGEAPAEGFVDSPAPVAPPSTPTRTSLSAEVPASTPTRLASFAPTQPAPTTTSRPTSTSSPTATATPGPTRTPVPTPAFDYAVASKTQSPRAVGANDVTYIRGRVEDEQGNLVSGATLRIASGGDWSAEGPVVDRRNGTFEFAVTRGTFSLLVLDARSEVATGLYTGSAGGSDAYDWEVVFRHTTMPAEAMTDENGTPLPTRTPTTTPSPSPTPISPGRNIAPDAHVEASANRNDERLAVDRDTATLWNSMLYPWSSAGDPPFIRLDYDQVRLVEGIELVVAQTPGGSTVHELWMMDEDGDWGTSPVTTFQQNTSDGQVLAYRLSPAREVKGLYVRTTRSPSFVAWREIRVYSPIAPPGGYLGATPTPVPTPISRGANIAPEADWVQVSANVADAGLTRDGDTGTIWNSGDDMPWADPSSPPFVEFDYAAPRWVEAIELVVAQGVAGDTIHEVWLRDADGDWDSSPVETFEESTSDGQVLSHHLSAARHVTGVYVRTTSSPSTVAWREIRIFEPVAPPGGFPTSTPRPTSTATPTATGTITPTPTATIAGSVSTATPTGSKPFAIPAGNVSSFEGEQPGFALANAVDANASTSWRPVGVTPTATMPNAYLTIDLVTDNASEYVPSADRLVAVGLRTDVVDFSSHTYSVSLLDTNGTPYSVASCEFAASSTIQRTCSFTPPYSNIRAVQIAISPNDGRAGVAEFQAWRSLRSGEPPTSIGSGPGAAPLTPTAWPGSVVAQPPRPAAVATSAPRSVPPARALATPPDVPTGGPVEFILLLETKPGSGYR